MPAKKKTKKKSHEDVLNHLVKTLKKWKHTMVNIDGQLYIAHHVEKKHVKMYNPKHIHEIKVKSKK